MKRGLWVAFVAIVLGTLAACGGGSSSSGGGGGASTAPGPGGEACDAPGALVDTFTVGGTTYTDSSTGAAGACGPDLFARLRNPGPYGFNEVFINVRVLTAAGAEDGGWKLSVQTQGTVTGGSIVTGPATGQAAFDYYEGNGLSAYCMASGGTVTVDAISATIGGTISGTFTGAGSTSWSAQGGATCPLGGQSGEFSVTIQE